MWCDLPAQLQHPRSIFTAASLSLIDAVSGSRMFKMSFRNSMVMGCLSMVFFVGLADYLWIHSRQDSLLINTTVPKHHRSLTNHTIGDTKDPFPIFLKTNPAILYDDNSTGTSPTMVMNPTTIVCLSNPIFSNYFHPENHHKDFLTTLWWLQTDNHEENLTTPSWSGMSAAQPQLLPQQDVNQHRNKRNLLILIGDSLDRMMLEHVCHYLRGATQKVVPDKVMARLNVCHIGTHSNSTFSEIGYVNIFGMHRQCQPQTIQNVDAGQPLDQTTAQRITRVLPQVLDLMSLSRNQESIQATTIAEESQPHSLEFFVQVGSNLWDLSTDCNDQYGVTADYEREYRQGIVEVYDAIIHTIQEYVRMETHNSIAINVHVLWKLAPPVSLKYSNVMKRQGHGRVRGNQQKLNDILRNVIIDSNTGTAATTTGNTTSYTNYSLGSGLVDWWKIVTETIPSEAYLNDLLGNDGRHYPECPSLVFFNALMEEVDRISF
jgi:hypothetical protein